MSNFVCRPQRQRLIWARVSPEEAGAAGEESSGADRTMAEGDLQPQEEERGREVAGVKGRGAQHKGEVEDEEGEDPDAPFKPFVLPGEWRKKKNRLLKPLNGNHTLPWSLICKHSSLALISALMALINEDSWLLCE